MTQAKELENLDELIGGLDERVDTPEGLMREHLTAARSCLLESAPEEYKMVLEMAKETLPQVEDPAMRSRIDRFLKQHTSL